MNTLEDNFLRTIDYIRLSTTDRRNLRCIYCMPSDGILPSKHNEIPTYEKIIRIIRNAAGLYVMGNSCLNENTSHQTPFTHHFVKRPISKIGR